MIREKRVAVSTVLTAVSLFTIASSFLYGLWYQQSASQAIDDLQQDHNSVVKAFESKMAQEDHLHKIEHNTFIKTEDSVIKSYTELYKDICSVRSSFNYQLLQYVLLESISKLWLEISESISGKINDLIISPDQLGRLLEDNTLFKDTIIYTQDKSLFFTLSETSLISADRSNKILYYFIKTPRIFPQELSEVYQIHNIGWSYGSLSYKYKTPDYVMITTDSNSPVFLEITRDNCRVTDNFWSCLYPDPILSTQTKCVTKLVMYKDVSECTILSKSAQHHSKIISSTRSGILLLGYEKYGVHKKFKTQVSNSKEIPCNIDKPKFINYNEFDYLTVGSSHIPSQNHPLIVVPWSLSETELPSVPSIVYDDISSSQDWKDLNSSILAYELSSWEFHSESGIRNYVRTSNHKILFIMTLIITILIILVLILVFRECKQGRRQRQEKSELIRLRELKALISSSS